MTEEAASQRSAVRARRFQPLDFRISLCKEVLALREKSYTPNQIIETIKNGHSVRLPKSTISYWVRGISSPFRAGHLFTPNPTPELVYVIGVECGDGFLSVRLDSE